MLRVAVVANLLGATLFAETAFSAQPVFKSAQVIEFESISYTYPPSPFRVKQAKKLGIPVETKTEPSIRLTGYLTKPEGEEPNPAIVLMHTCAGISEHEEGWADRLVSWGYVVLAVDSLTPRDLTYICEARPGSPTPWLGALDAHGAKRYLSTLTFVDPTRIAVMGMSHGGGVVLEVIKQSTSAALAMSPFRAAVALYPLCGEPEPTIIPTLVLIGGEDNWTPAQHCVMYFDKLKRPHEMTLKVFPGAHHLFDHPGIDRVDLGYILRSDPETATQANQMIRKFLGERL